MKVLKKQLGALCVLLVLAAVFCLHAAAEPAAFSVTVGGAAKYGGTLTASVSGDDLGTLSYQWQAGGADIAGATNATYTLTTAEIGKTVACKVTSSGKGVSTSAATAQVTKATPTLADFNITLPDASTTYDGANKEAIVTPRDSMPNVIGTITVLYQKSDSSTATAVKPVAAGTYKVLISAAGGDGYQPIYNLDTERTFTIKKATPTTADFNITLPSALTYSGTPKKASVTEKKSGMGTITVSYKKNGAAFDGFPVDVGTYTVVISTTTGTNYEATAAPLEYAETFAITRAEPKLENFTLDVSDATYDGQTHAKTITPKSGGMGTNVTVKYQNITDPEHPGTATTTAPTAVGRYKVLISIGEGANYTALAEKDFGLAFFITRAPLTITAKPKTITYGDAPANDGVDYDGFVNDENESVLEGTLTYTCSYNQYGDVGTYSITPGGVTAANYDITFADGILTVEQKEVALTWSHTDDLVYNGTEQKPTATVAAGSLVNGDTCTVTVTGGQTNAREDNTYVATASGLVGDKSGNYKLPDYKATSFNIKRKPVTVTAKPQTVGLGASLPGDASRATLTDTDGNALSGALKYHKLTSVTLTLAPGASTANVGTFPNAVVPASAVIKSGNDDLTANYAITYVPGALTVEPGQATVEDAPQARSGLVYDATYQDLLEGGRANTALEYRFDGEENYSTNVPTGKLAGAYKIWYRAQEDANHAVGTARSIEVTIGKRPVTVTVEAVDRPYQEGSRSVNLSSPAIEGGCGESVGVDLSAASAVMADDSAGVDKPVTVTGIKLGDNAENYVLRSDRPSNDVTVTIGKIDYAGGKTAAASVLPGKTESVSLATLIAAGGAAGEPVVSAAAYSIDPDTVALNGTILSFTAKDDAEKDKTATITVPVTGMTNHNDYNITVTVTIAEKKGLTLSASDITKTYDGDPVEDSAISGTARADGKNVPGTWSFKSGQGLTNAADSGEKIVIFTPDDPTSYKDGTATLTLTIEKAGVTVRALDRRVVLGGTAPDLSDPVRGTDYEVSADVVAGAVTLKYQKAGADVTPSATEAGTYDIIIGGVAPADPDNYTLELVNGKLTVAAATLYKVETADGIEHGRLTVSTASAAEGATVTVTATPDNGYALDAITTTPALTITKNSFVMPAEDVLVSATFKTAPLSGTVTISGYPYVGETLTATLSGSNSTGSLTYQWKANGVALSGETSRTLYLTASEEGDRITCTVTSTAPAGSITSSAVTVYSEWGRTDDFWLDETQLYLNVGESGYLIARTWTGRLYDDEVRWRSSNSKVVSVDRYGNYYAEGTGSAVIYATLTGYSSYYGNYNAYCNVTVSRYGNSNNNNRTNIVIEQPTIPSGASNQNSTTTQAPTLEEIKQTTTTNRDGSKQTVIAKADGSSSVVQTDGVGRVTSAAVTYSQKAVDGASWSNSALVLPATVRASYDTNGAPELRIVMPQTTQGAYVKIPVENMTTGTVAVIENAFGPDEIVRNSISQSDGLTIKLKGSAVVKIVDNSRQFYDVNSSDWYASAVAWVTSHGVMNGVSEHMFNPEGQMNRAMMTQILYNFAGASSTNVTSAFSDVSAKDWYGKSVTWASDNGIAHIFDDRFGATEPLTREDMASMLYNYARKMGYNTSAAGNLSSFSDNGSISSWARPAVEWAVGTGLFGGVSGDRLAPQGVATRGQLAVIMQRFCENVVK